MDKIEKYVALKNEYDNLLEEIKFYRATPLNTIVKIDKFLIKFKKMTDEFIKTISEDYKKSLDEYYQYKTLMNYKIEAVYLYEQQTQENNAFFLNSLNNGKSSNMEYNEDIKLDIICNYNLLVFAVYKLLDMNNKLGYVLLEDNLADYTEFKFNFEKISSCFNLYNNLIIVINNLSDKDFKEILEFSDDIAKTINNVRIILSILEMSANKKIRIATIKKDKEEILKNHNETFFNELYRVSLKDKNDKNFYLEIDDLLNKYNKVGERTFASNFFINKYKSDTNLQKFIISNLKNIKI